MQDIAVREPQQQVAAADTLRWLNAIESDSDKIIVSLSHRTDDELLDIRAAARGMGRAAWLIECAADAEIMNRISAHRGRLKDKSGQGVHAAVLKTAQQTGLSERTIYDNAAIYKTFFVSASARRNKDANGAMDILEDKEFFRAAMRSDDPHATLEKFAQAKTDNPFFNTRDAWRMVKESKTPDIDSPMPHLFDDDTIKAKWEAYKKASAELMGVVPRLISIVRPTLDEVEYELSRPPDTIRGAIYDAITDGFDEIDEIAKRINRHRTYVTVWMNHLEDDGYVERFEKPRVPGARGQARTGYNILK